MYVQQIIIYYIHEEGNVEPWTIVSNWEIEYRHEHIVSMSKRNMSEHFGVKNSIGKCVIFLLRR